MSSDEKDPNLCSTEGCGNEAVVTYRGKPLCQECWDKISADPADKPAKSGKASKPAKASKPGKSAKSDKSAKPGKADKPAKEPSDRSRVVSEGRARTGGEGRQVFIQILAGAKKGLTRKDLMESVCKASKLARATVNAYIHRCMKKGNKSHFDVWVEGKGAEKRYFGKRVGSASDDSITGSR